jgi:hypothetical protein
METPEQIHEKRVDDLTTMHSTLIGKAFDELDEDQLRILLAYEYWKDGMDLEVIFEDSLYADEKDKTSKASVILVLKSQFGYTFKTIIQ